MGAGNFGLFAIGRVREQQAALKQRLPAFRSHAEKQAYTLAALSGMPAANGQNDMFSAPTDLSQAGPCKRLCVLGPANRAA
jgi:hypothetical protein